MGSAGERTTEGRQPSSYNDNKSRNSNELPQIGQRSNSLDNGVESANAIALTDGSLAGSPTNGSTDQTTPSSTKAGSSRRSRMVTIASNNNLKGPTNTESPTTMPQGSFLSAASATSQNEASLLSSVSTTTGLSVRGRDNPNLRACSSGNGIDDSAQNPLSSESPAEPQAAAATESNEVEH